MIPAPQLDVHGFVLAGGRSSRMGCDKATVRFQGQSLAAIAAATLRSVCSWVSIAGARPDLAVLAPPVPDLRSNQGPVGGLEAGLAAAQAPWALFVPVDVPLAPAALLRSWASAVLELGGQNVCLSTLRVAGQVQPAFCMLHRRCASALSTALDRGERKISRVLHDVALEMGGISRLWVADVEGLAAFEAQEDAAAWLRLFSNVNTPEDLRRLEGGGVEGAAPALQPAESGWLHG